MTASSILIDGLKTEKRRKKIRKQAEPDMPIQLSFDTQRIFKAKQIRSVDQIMFNASDMEYLSLQPTVRLEVKPFSSELENGVTLMNKVSKRNFFKAQAFTLTTISGMGLLIGLFIAYFI